MQDAEPVVDRKKSPDYAQVVGHIKKDVAVELKIFCAQNDTTITEVIEKSLEEYLEKYGKPKRKKSS